MKILQTKVAMMEHAMLRRIIIGLTTGIALAFSTLGSINPADAQAAPLCDRFGPGAAGLDGWGACPAAPNITVTTSNNASIGGPGDYYLLLTDLSGASAACSTNEKYLGDWVKKMGGCGQFCFDFKVFNSGSPPGPITPSFTIWNGPAHATFVANFTVTANDPWRQHICAPINLSATPPSGPQGHWVTTGNWNLIITNVTMIQLPIDFTSQPSEVAGYDNLCMEPQACPPPPPVIDGCLKDSKVTVTCNPDGTYTVTLSSAGSPGDIITMSSSTAGVTVAPPQQNWASTTTWTITGASPGQTVVLNVTSTKPGGGEASGTDQCCSGTITIVMPDCPKKVGEVIVEKKVKNDTRASASVINSLVFPIGLSCTLPSTLSTSFGLHNGGTHTENNVPYTSVCTVTESTLTLPPVPKDVCGEGSTAVWLTPVISVTPSATIGAPVTVFTVVNELQCVKVGQLSVTKTVRPDPRGLATSLSFPMTVTCTNPPAPPFSYTLIVHGNTSSVLHNVPVGSICTVTETQPALPAGCTWLPPVTTSVTIHAGLNQTMVTNAYRCQECPPPQVMNADGICTCPPPMVPIPGAICGCPPPMVPGPVAGTCICPNNEVLVGGKCVPKIVCDRPLVPNAAGTSCVCRAGLVLRRGKCVEIERPKREIKCPRGTVRKDGECVKQKREPQIEIPHGLPGLGGGGRGNGGGGQGGGAAPGKR